MLDMAKVTAHDYVIDLGSGDGRTVITAAKRGARALGVEFNPAPESFYQEPAMKRIPRDAAVSVRSITREGSRRIVQAAFDYAVRHGRRKVTAVHKANVLRTTCGLFLEEARAVIEERAREGLFLAFQYPVEIPGLGATLHVARTIVDKLVDRAEENTYLSVPKLKTHSMSVVTLALKSQIGLLRHADRIPLHDDRRLFEMLILEGAQAGLSWITILRKREAFREAFDGFDPSRVAKYDGRKISELLHNPGIIRNRLKIQAAVQNAQAFLKIVEEFGSFHRYLWQFVENRTVQNRWRKPEEIPARTKESDAMRFVRNSEYYKSYEPYIKRVIKTQRLSLSASKNKYQPAICKSCIICS
jgi:DNA-3-methyladenine glycosylase I